MMASLDKVSLKLGFYGLLSKLMLTKRKFKRKTLLVKNISTKVKFVDDRSFIIVIIAIRVKMELR